MTTVSGSGGSPVNQQKPDSHIDPLPCPLRLIFLGGLDPRNEVIHRESPERESRSALFGFPSLSTAAGAETARLRHPSRMVDHNFAKTSDCRKLADCNPAKYLLFSVRLTFFVEFTIMFKLSSQNPCGDFFCLPSCVFLLVLPHLLKPLSHCLS